MTPDEDRPGGEPEIAPHPVDAERRAAPGGIGDVGDRGKERRVDHRRPEPERDARREPRPEAGRRGDGGDGDAAWTSSPPTISPFRPIRSDRAPVASCDVPQVSGYAAASTAISVSDRPAAA